MIRNVVAGRLRPGVSPSEIEPALRELRVDGVEFVLLAGVDMGLRGGGASFAVTADFADAGDYRADDAEHNRIRREMFAPLTASTERVQFELP